MKKVATSGHTIDGSRITFLRELNGMTLKDIAGYLNVTSSYVSQMEHNKRNIDFSTVLKLSDLFKIPHEFILNNDELPHSSKTRFFRKKSIVTKKKQVQAVQKTRLFSYFEETVSSDLRLRYFVLPKYANFESEFRLLPYNYIDQIVDSIRNSFNFGNGPISNMTLLVEKMGIRVSFVNLEDEGIDAITIKNDGRFYMLINSKVSSSVRIRFNIAHELGHIFLHFNYLESNINNTSNYKRIEAEANHFAGALLMPEDGLATDMYFTNMEHLMFLKRHWLVSIQSLIYRGNEIGLITDQQALFLRQTISRNHWRYNEPYDNKIPIEKPTFLSSALKFLDIDENEYIQYLSKNKNFYSEQICYYLNLDAKDDTQISKQYRGPHLV